MTKKATSSPGKIEVKQVVSAIGKKPLHKNALSGLGLKKVNQLKILEDTPSVRGLLEKVKHLVEIKNI